MKLFPKIIIDECKTFKPITLEQELKVINFLHKKYDLPDLQTFNDDIIYDKESNMFIIKNTKNIE